MQHVREILDRAISGIDALRLPVAWSNTRRDELNRIAKGETPVRAAIDVELALPLLQCADGEFEQAESKILAILDANLEVCEKHSESFISAIAALFIVQRL